MDHNRFGLGTLTDEEYDKYREKVYGTKQKAFRPQSSEQRREDLALEKHWENTPNPDEYNGPF